MTRTLCILTGLILTASLPLWDHFGRGTDPTGSELAQAWGGNPSNGTKNARCDQNVGAGLYLGCSGVPGTCAQCVNVQNDGSFSAAMANFTNGLTTPVSPGYEVKPTQPRQACGLYLLGRCVNDATSPTGFSCVGTPSQTNCLQTQAVGAQAGSKGPPPVQQ